MFAHWLRGHFQSVSAVATVLSITGVLVSAFVVYAIYRYGLIPANATIGTTPSTSLRGATVVGSIESA